MKIAVVGLGHVGLLLSLQCAQSCVSMIGLDVDAKKVQLLNNGQSYIRQIKPSAIAELVKSGKFLRLHGIQPDQRGGGGDPCR